MRPFFTVWLWWLPLLLSLSAFPGHSELAGIIAYQWKSRKSLLKNVFLLEEGWVVPFRKGSARRSCRCVPISDQSAEFVEVAGLVIVTSGAESVWLRNVNLIQVWYPWKRRRIRNCEIYLRTTTWRAWMKRGYSQALRKTHPWESYCWTTWRTITDRCMVRSKGRRWTYSCMDLFD